MRSLIYSLLLLDYEDKGGGRGCHNCISSTGGCLDRRCEGPKYEWTEWERIEGGIGRKKIRWNNCTCSEDECNSSIQMYSFWPNLMLSFVIYLKFLY